MTPAKRAVSTAAAPKAIGPYSQAVRAGGFLYCSGQIALDASTGRMAGDDVSAQTRKVLENLGAVLAAAGLDFSDVVKATVYLTDLSRFAEMNDVYGGFFSAPFPARAAMEVSALPKGALVEIEAVARLKD